MGDYLDHRHQMMLARTVRGRARHTVTTHAKRVSLPSSVYVAHYKPSHIAYATASTQRPLPRSLDQSSGPATPTPSPAASVEPAVSIFWDFENCRIPTDYSTRAAVHALLTAVRLATLPYNSQKSGPLVQFQVYGDWSLLPKDCSRELARVGATLVNTPHVAGLSNTADLALITDALGSVNSLNETRPLRIFCLLGDRDYGPMLRMLRHWHHEVVLINPHPTTMHLPPSVAESADAILSWRHDILDSRFKYTPDWRAVASQALKPRQKESVAHLRSPVRAFAPLMDTLLAFQMSHGRAPKSNEFHKELLRAFPDAYARAGVATAEDYIALAVGTELLFPASLEGDTVRLDRHHFMHLVKLQLSAFPFPAAAAADLVEPERKHRYRLEGSFLSGRRVGGPVIPLRRDQRNALRRLRLSPLTTYSPLIESLLFTLRSTDKRNEVQKMGKMLTTEFGVDVFGQLGMSGWSIYLQSAIDAGIVRLVYQHNREAVQLHPDWLSTLVHLEAFTQPSSPDPSPLPARHDSGEPSPGRASSQRQPTKHQLVQGGSNPGQERIPLEKTYAPSDAGLELPKDEIPPFDELISLIESLRTLEKGTQMSLSVSSGLLVKPEDWERSAILIPKGLAKTAQSLGLVHMYLDDLTTLALSPRFYIRLYRIMDKQWSSAQVAADKLQRRWREQTRKGNLYEWYQFQARTSRRMLSPLYTFVPLLDILLSHDAGNSELMLPALKGAVLSASPDILLDAQLDSWDQYVSMAKGVGLISVDVSGILPTVALRPEWMTALFHLELLHQHVIMPPPRPIPPRPPKPVSAPAPEAAPRPSPTGAKIVESGPARVAAVVDSPRRKTARGEKPAVASAESLRKRFSHRTKPSQIQAALLSENPVEAFGPLINMLLQMGFHRLVPLSVQLSHAVLPRSPDTLAVAGVDDWDTFLSLAQAAGIIQLSTTKGGEATVSLEPDFYAPLAESLLASQTTIEPSELEAFLDAQRVKQWNDPLTSFNNGVEEDDNPLQHHAFGVTDVIWRNQKDSESQDAQSSQEPSPALITARHRTAAKDIDAPLEAFAPLIESLLKSGGSLPLNAEAGQLFATRFPGIFKLANTLGWKAYLKRASEVGITVEVIEDGTVELQPDFWVTLLDLYLILKGKLQPRHDSFLNGPDLSPTQSRLHQLVQANGSAWTVFEPLIHVLFLLRERGEAWPDRVHVRATLSVEFNGVYTVLDVRGFDEYVTLAEAAGLALSDSIGSKRFALDARWYARLLQLQKAAFPNAQQATEGLFSSSSILTKTEGWSGSQSLADQAKADFQHTSPSVPSVLDGICTNALHTFMPLVDMMLTRASPWSPQTTVPKAWIRTALDVNFDSLYSQIGIRGFEEYIQIAEDASLLIKTPDDCLQLLPLWWQSLTHLQLAGCQYSKAHPGQSTCFLREQGLLTETILLGNQADKLAHENITEVLDPLSAEMREYLRDLVQESGSVAQVFAAHIDQLLHVPGQEIGGHDDRLDQVSNKLGLFQHDEVEPWNWLSKLADVELALRPHDAPTAEVRLARDLPASPANVVRRLLICRGSSVQDDLATCSPTQLCTAFEVSTDDVADLIRRLQLAGLITAVHQRPSRSEAIKFLFGRSGNAAHFDQIRLAPDWWYQFVRLHAAFQAK